MPYLRALSSFRDGVRQLAMAKNNDGRDALKEILALSDSLRDVDLVPLGVALDDQPGTNIPNSLADHHKQSLLADGKALVKLVSPQELIKARDEKRALADSKAAKKAAAAEADRLKRQQRMEKGRVPPEEMFKPPNVTEGTYSSWDATGIPVTDREGKDISKSGAKKFAKEWGAQKKLHEEFLAWREGQGQL